MTNSILLQWTNTHRISRKPSMAQKNIRQSWSWACWEDLEWETLWVTRGQGGDHRARSFKYIW